MTKADQQRDPAPAVSRSLRILTELADSPSPMPLTELAKAIGAAKSSTLNLLLALEEGRMVRRCAEGYRLGRRTVELGGSYIGGFNQIREFYAFCADSPVIGGELVQVAMLDGTDVLHLARHEGKAPYRLSAGIGSRFPAAPTAVGNALLTTLTDDEIGERFRRPEHFPQRTARSVAGIDDLLAKVRQARERGYAVDDNEVHSGIFGVAVVLPPWASGDPALALGASLPDVEATPQRIGRVVAELRCGVAELSNPLVMLPKQ
jgi:DNA-binding IclR family transcriptional regulator